MIFHIGHRLSFEAVVLDLFIRTFKARGQVYEEYICLAGQIKERQTGQLFRDHCHIKVTKSIYELLKKYSSGCPVYFVGSVYRYSKLVETRRYSYRKFQLGLERINLLSQR